MPVTLTLKKPLEKNIVYKDVKNYLVCDSDIVDVLEFSISCKNWGILSRGRE